MKVINKLGQLVGKIKEDGSLVVIMFDLKKAMKEYDKDQDLTEFLKEKGFRIE